MQPGILRGGLGLSFCFKQMWWEALSWRSSQPWVGFRGEVRACAGELCPHLCVPFRSTPCPSGGSPVTRTSWPCTMPWNWSTCDRLIALWNRTAALWPETRPAGLSLASAPDSWLTDLDILMLSCRQSPRLPLWCMKDHVYFFRTAVASSTVNSMKTSHENVLAQCNVSLPH